MRYTSMYRARNNARWTHRSHKKWPQSLRDTHILQPWYLCMYVAIRWMTHIASFKLSGLGPIPLDVENGGCWSTGTKTPKYPMAPTTSVCGSNVYSVMNSHELYSQASTARDLKSRPISPQLVRHRPTPPQIKWTWWTSHCRVNNYDRRPDSISSS